MKVYELMQLLSFKASGAEVMIDVGDADGSWPAGYVGYVGDKVLITRDRYAFERAAEYHEAGGAE